MGCVIALIGISLISFSGTTMHLNPIGDLLSVGAAIIWSFYSVLSKNRKFWLFCSSGNKKNLFLWNTIYDPGIIYI